jgi:hypothetical protein
MTTALDLITKAMQKAGIITKNEAPASDEAADALDTLNDLWESWSTESLLATSRTKEVFTVTGGVQEYTIGIGGDFDTIRPILLVDAFVRLGDIDYNLIKITDSDEATIPYKGIQGIPQFINYNNGSPLGVISLFPLPESTYELHLITEKPLLAVALNTVVSLPPGWSRATIYNLAIELAPEYGQEAPPSVQRIAGQSLGNIKRTVAKNRTMDVPIKTRGGYNIYTGGY